MAEHYGGTDNSAKQQEEDAWDALNDLNNSHHELERINEKNA